MKIGYARVSTDSQELGRQIKSLEDYGCDIIYQEKISGAKTKRPELDKMMATLQPKDAVIVPKLDRLGRSLSHLINILSKLKLEGVTFVSLGDNFDTSTPQGMLMFHMIGAFAEFERAIIRERVNDGIKFAAANGRHGGRKFKYSAEEIAQLIADDWGVTAIARLLGCTRRTVYNFLNKSKLNLTNGQ